ncbi:hypothetical protein CHGG_07177 [Chaetomium globosum CBS 148.51]|uniref:Rap-GAP domain-containing protein n=1 Tax=Chaetomium globosum (strain ATCC 6205 / CBS 148.51 / DSM 1962 / NBRC 6347 / NRRL 1970) TaxID=306901 RepID=Q2GXX7_CHAGB|nr:uncharacterized protein CHGG_07177 [Chaetomium globosum CBS 148.51]EAQ85924.1 hypothetical protein CHGG_07177 [Chaetomium globosum CBS 148.51]
MPACVFLDFKITHERLADMLRRLASLGHSAAEDQQLMSPSPGDEQHPQETKGSGGLAGVFKGLAGGGKLTKSPPVIQQPFPPISGSQALPQRSDATPPMSALHGLSPDQAELFVHLKNGQLNERVAAANSLRYAIADFPLNPVRDIWHAAKDLIDPANPANARQIAWELLTECIKYPSSTELERREYFSTLANPALPDDFYLQLAALEDLTNRGRDVSGFYYDIFPLLTRWLEEAYRAARTARRQASRGPTRVSKGSTLSTGEDKNLSRLFALLNDAIKFNFKFARDDVVGRLMAILLKICMNTSVEDDLRACIIVVDRVVTYGAIPNDKLKDCIQILSSIHCLVPSLQKDAWHTISIICRSHHGQSAVRILLDLLRTYSTSPDKDKDKDSVRDVRGALSVLKRLLFKSADKGYPAVSLALLVDGLATVSKSSSTRIATEILKLINAVFDGREGNINPILVEENWSPIFAVAAQCATKVAHPPPAAESSASSISTVVKDEREPEETVAVQLKYLVTRIETLLANNDPEFLQRDECMVFLSEIQQVLPDSAAALVVAYLKETRACFPSEVGWEDSLKLVLNAFFLNKGREPLTRLRALEVVIEVYDFLCLAQGLVDEDSVARLVQQVLAELPAEIDSLVLQETTAFLIKVAETAPVALFDDILDAFKGVVAKDKTRPPPSVLAPHRAGPTLQSGGQTIYFANQSVSNVVTRGYVQIFIRTMSSNGSKAAKAYTALVHIARSNACEIDARLTAMKMLFRLRADYEHQVYLTTLVENETLAGTFFILIHLPAQLSNHPIFRDAIPHVQELRRLLCEMIRTNGFLEPPHSSGRRRSDVANCLFHSLIMIVSYHRHFQKTDEDEMVRTFAHGISDKTAKTCIHALSVCCHELPMSVSKSLVSILQKMSQVITQPLVAMHILEFLACLSRLHSLYSNFREDDYRIVLGICFRYLQYVREKKLAMRGSVASEPATPSSNTTNHTEFLAHQSTGDDLPQYVYALAYHVITFWFLAVKLPDRPNQIGWITKNLFTDVDGTASTEEHAQITLDFMQRVAFSDAGDSAQDPLFKEQFFGEIQKKRWIIGNSILTIRQATESCWAEITRRYPSGTSSYALRVEFTPTPNLPAPDGSDAAAWEGRFQDGVTIFPSHLLMQLLAPMPQLYDPAIRPIPLPDEDFVDRAVRVFDRNSPVDGHKVGVVYIKEGQTKETEILANTTGSPDYHQFLKGLGTLTKLKGATFNTHGLDRENDIDGKYAYCFRDRVTEIMFHVTTQMPTNPETDPQCIMKKRHIGNDYVNIVWNDSVQVMSQLGFPEISPAAEPKMISLKALPSFVRLLALNASVFSLVWANREDGEHVSSWRERLRQINALRTRYGPKAQGVSASPPPGAIATPSAASTTVAPGGLPTVGGNHGGIGHHHQPSVQGAPVLGAGGEFGTAGAGGVNNARGGGMRDSFSSSLRRSSVATFFTSAPSTDQSHQSHRSSMLSTVTTENAEVLQQSTAEALVDSVDFSKWT